MGECFIQILSLSNVFPEHRGEVQLYVFIFLNLVSILSNKRYAFSRARFLKYFNNLIAFVETMSASCKAICLC